MRTHYDLQREVIEAALRLLDDIELHGDAFGIEVFRRQLADSGHRFSEADLRYLGEIEERAAKFRSLKAKCDKAEDGEVEDAICDEMDAERDWLLAEREILKNVFGRLLR
jgi:hypothetical protein